MTSEELVLVTGASGFIASHIIKVLVEKGYRVRGTVRRLSEKGRYDGLYHACGDPERSKLEFVEADLESSAEVWDAAVKDCTACIHTAAPVKLTVTDVQKELVDPILKGVANVLGACQRSGTVKRVVYTSSITALSDSFEKWKSHVYNADDWNTKSTKTYNAYPYAKTLGERAALEFAKTNKAFSLACVLPFTVVGPHLLVPTHLPDTMDIPMRGALCGEMWRINYHFGISDVRDTAIVHVAAMEHLPRDASAHDKVPRYIVWSGTMDYKDMLNVFANTLPDRKKYLPKYSLPNTIVLFYLKRMMPAGIYQYVRANLGGSPRFDVSNVENELGVHFRPREETIRDCCLYLKEAGYLDNDKLKSKKKKS
jgi:dihydroflavonol-4-reductase